MKEWTHRLLLLALAGFFILAGGLKLADPVGFARSIVNYQLIGGTAAWSAALWVAWLEVLAGGFLLLRKWRRAALLLILLLLCAFEAALFSAFLRGLDIDCGCFGTKAASSVSFAMVRNLFLMAAVLWAIKVEPSQRPNE